MPDRPLHRRDRAAEARGARARRDRPSSTAACSAATTASSTTRSASAAASASPPASRSTSCASTPREASVVVGPREALATRTVRAARGQLARRRRRSTALAADGLRRSRCACAPPARRRPALLRLVGGEAEVELLDGEYGVSPGQACVFYDGRRPARARAGRRRHPRRRCAAHPSRRRAPRPRRRR